MFFVLQHRNRPLLHEELGIGAVAQDNQIPFFGRSLSFCYETTKVIPPSGQDILWDFQVILITVKCETVTSVMQTTTEIGYQVFK